MPTRPSKGSKGPSNTGSKERGGQKATYGSSVSSEVAEGQADAIGTEGDDVADDDDEGRPS